ncbi:ShKT domain-containing protein [Caenorhabditis elegans]|uniref:ShKT domain-containing protein n=1 Tax=Caenorhabditis elegans TaxID=6239 RepID=G5ECJ2_CAEEL|nr:ShKT domain-containing protein [Caenorhabditis elegans]CAA91281.3 ShKT domain-containing protein [Caenorhabditis elegans]|eukprot:NP_001254246.1 Uncharacterized protein CELE_E04D5.4 [Caenorhabditis elegans]
MWSINLTVHIILLVTFSVSHVVTTAVTKATGETTVRGAGQDLGDVSSSFFYETTTATICADDPNIGCTQYISLCSNAKYSPFLQEFCPMTCGFCAEETTTASTCADDPNTDCTQYTFLCSNAKYTPLLQQFCAKTCGFCGSGSTAAPVACVDTSTQCAYWNKNGFCSSIYYDCATKKEFCAKTCNFCSITC